MSTFSVANFDGEELSAALVAEQVTEHVQRVDAKRELHLFAAVHVTRPTRLQQSN